jgi:hypothetical protein
MGAVPVLAVPGEPGHRLVPGPVLRLVQGGSPGEHQAAVGGGADLRVPEVGRVGGQPGDRLPGGPVVGGDHPDRPVGGDVPLALAEGAEPPAVEADQVGEGAVRGLVPDASGLDQLGPLGRGGGCEGEGEHCDHGHGRLPCELSRSLPDRRPSGRPSGVEAGAPAGDRGCRVVTDPGGGRPGASRLGSGRAGGSARRYTGGRPSRSPCRASPCRLPSPDSWKPPRADPGPTGRCR